jgi:hypothetical protein
VWLVRDRWYLGWQMEAELEHVMKEDWYWGYWYPDDFNNDADDEHQLLGRYTKQLWSSWLDTKEESDVKDVYDTFERYDMILLFETIDGRLAMKIDVEAPAKMLADGDEKRCFAGLRPRPCEWMKIRC